MIHPTPPDWRHTILPGHTPDGAFFVTIELHTKRNPSHGPELSICGVIGPKRNGDATGSAGQCVDQLLELNSLSTGWTPAMVHRLHEIWKRWHLNGMNAGTVAQQEELRKHEFPGYPLSHLDWARAVLARVGLEPDGDYSYGSAWLYEELPPEILDELWALPTSPREHPWSGHDEIGRPT